MSRDIQAPRMGRLAPYLFATLDRKKQEALDRGVDVISLTIGDPDLPTPAAIVAAGQVALAKPANHRYPSYNGAAFFREKAAAWMQRRFGVTFDPAREMLALIGSKEGIAHLSFACLGAGDLALCPEPGYPVYAISARLAGAEAHDLPLLASHQFLPDLKAVPAAVCRAAKILWINYPNNPTGAVAPASFYEEAIAFCRQHDLILASDAAYTEIAFGDYRPPSVFEFAGAREVAVEFHSHSKTYNMTGWRVGFACGRADVIEALARLKSNLDSGVFTAVQEAGVAAMELWPAHLADLMFHYQRRRDVLVEGLREAGYDPPSPLATFYVWMPVPGGDDVAFANRLIEQAGVLLTPGSGFGKSGRGYVRFALTVGEERTREAVARIARLGLA